MNTAPNYDNYKPAAEQKHTGLNDRRYHAYISAPYVRSLITTGDLMYFVVLSLLPCAGVGIYHYGFHAALLVGISVLTAILAELACDAVSSIVWRRRLSHTGQSKEEPRRSNRAAVPPAKASGSRGQSVMDYSCIVTGLIGGLILPPAAPFWFAILLPAAAIVVFKHLSGGLGRNLLNPAMAGKFVLLLAARSTALNISTWEYTDGSPLAMLQSGETPSLLAMIVGDTSGYIGTASAAAVLLTVVILYIAGMIEPDIPFSAIISFSICYILIGRYGLSAYTLGVQICGGSFLFTVFIMAQDFSTTPVSRRARILYGIILGVLIFVFRRLGFWEDACVYALLIVNVLRPVLDRWLPQAYFGVNSNKWVIQETKTGKKIREEQHPQVDEKTNDVIDAEFAAFEAKIERETRGLETARYTGDDTMLREAMADVPEGTFRKRLPGSFSNSSYHDSESSSAGYFSSAPRNNSGQNSNSSNMSEHERRIRLERAKKKEIRNRRESSRDVSLEEARKMIEEALKKEQDS